MLDMFLTRNLRVYSDRLKYGREPCDPSLDTIFVGPADVEGDRLHFEEHTLPRLCFSSQVFVLNNNISKESHVASEPCALLGTVLILATKAETIVIRGFHLDFKHPRHMSPILTKLSLCNVHFAGDMDVLSLVAQLPALVSVFLHYVTCATDYPSGVRMPSKLREVMLTADHTTPALQYSGVRFQDHFMRWAAANPHLVPGLTTFAVWEVEDCTADVLLDLLKSFTARSIFPPETHITIRDGHEYAKYSLLKSSEAREFMKHSEQGRVQMEADVDHSLPEWCSIRPFVVCRM